MVFHQSLLLFSQPLSWPWLLTFLIHWPILDVDTPVIWLFVPCPIWPAEWPWEWIWWCFFYLAQPIQLGAQILSCLPPLSSLIFLCFLFGGLVSGHSSPWWQLGHGGTEVAERCRLGRAQQRWPGCRGVKSVEVAEQCRHGRGCWGGEAGAKVYQVGPGCLGGWRVETA